MLRGAGSCSSLSSAARADFFAVRRCFALNVPVGAVCIAVSIIFLQIPKDPSVTQPTVRQRLLELDWAGTPLLLGSLLCIILALQVSNCFLMWLHCRRTEVRICSGRWSNCTVELIIAHRPHRGFGCASRRVRFLCWDSLTQLGSRSSSPLRFGCVQHFLPATSSVPLRLFRSRNLNLCTALNFLIGASCE